MAQAKSLKYALLILFSTCHTIAFSQNSVLSTGTWVKLAVANDNIYKITYADLQAYGLDPASIDPGTFRVFGNGPGMLPQANNAPRPTDLEEIAIQIAGGDDGSFDPGDYILFWGSGPDIITFDSLSGVFYHENHLFTDTNYYYLTFGATTGLRISDLPAVSGGTLVNNAYTVYVHDIDKFNRLHSGRKWFGEKFELEATQTFSTPIENIAPASTITMVSSVLSISLQDATFSVNLNGVEVGRQPIPANPSGVYVTKGTVATDTFTVAKSVINDNPLEVTYKFEREYGVGYLDYFILQTKTLLSYSGQPLVFYTGNLANQGNITFSISNCPAGLTLWDISDHNRTQNVPYSLTGSTITFNVSHEIKKLVLFDATAVLAKPVSNEQISNQNLHASSATDLLIVAPEQFISQAQTIAAMREAEGLAVTIATPEQVYNEFSSGKPDITAIRDYAKLLYDNNGLQYLLMFGKGTYDPKNIMETGMGVLPIYQSRNSLQPLATYGSDDYLGFLEDNEGEWAESRSGDHTMDIGVGRIPAATPEEADNYVKKLQLYKDKRAVGAWRRKVVFVAENGDLNLHQRDAERLATLVDTTYATFTTKKIYVDAYPIEVTPATKRAPLANLDIYNTINQGALIINYTGHGNEIQWAKTKVFDKNTIDSLQNAYYLPLFVTATCEFGRHDDTGDRSGGEDLMVKSDIGAIATITTARPVFSSTNYQLNQAFYKEIFNQPNGTYQRLGDIFRKTKNNSLNGVLNRNFSLLGDPSLVLNYPRQTIRIDSLNGSPLSSADTLNTLAELRFSGSVRTPGQTIDTSFNGLLEIEIQDKATVKQTLGNLGATPFTYKERDNILFRGSATIVNGYFKFTTVLPKDISYKPDSGKISLYAHKSDSTSDGAGANIDLLIGSSPTTPIVDTTPPEIQLYLGDTNYTEGRVVNPNTLLIANLSDDFGINTSTNQVGHSITYTLDESEPVILNDYYTTTTNNYKNGWLYYNLPSLSPGQHTLSLTCWDTSNNSSTKTIDFLVSENNQIIISELGNYPNPMRESTTFTFAHNLTGEDIEVTLEVITTSGQKVYSQTRSYISAPSVINDWYWDGRNTTGGKLYEGIYIYGIIIRSKSTNLIQAKYARLFITN